MASSKVSALTAATVATIDDLLYLVDNPGVTPTSKAITVGNLLFKTQTLVDGATIPWDASLGRFATITLGGNRTLANPTNLINGARYTLIVIQDSGAPRLITFSSAYKFPGATAPTLSTGNGQKDILEFVSDGTNLYNVLFAANLS